MARRSAGRQKVPLEKIQNEDALQVTFSKRRSGIFKKAAELSILCRCDLGIFLFSPGGKPYSFGSTNVPHIMQRFLADGLAPQQESWPDHREMLVRGLTSDLVNATEAHNQALRRRRELTDTLMRADQAKAAELVDVGHLSQYIAMVKALKNLVELTKLELELDHRAQTDLPMGMNLFSVMQAMGSQQPAPMVDPCSYNNESPVVAPMGAHMGLPSPVNPHEHHGTAHGGVMMGFGSAQSSLHRGEPSFMGQPFEHPQSNSRPHGFLHP